MQGRSGAGREGAERGEGKGRRARGGEREVWSRWVLQAPLPGRLLGGGASCWVPRREGQGMCAAHGVPREACAQEAAGLPSPVPRPDPGPSDTLNPVGTGGGPEAPGLRSEGTSRALSSYPASSFQG